MKITTTKRALEWLEKTAVLENGLYRCRFCGNRLRYSISRRPLWEDGFLMAGSGETVDVIDFACTNCNPDATAPDSGIKRSELSEVDIKTFSD